MALRLGDDVPIEYQSDYERWKGEPVRAIIIPKKLFRQNGKGYPVLLRHHQNIILSLAHLEPYIIIEVSFVAKYQRQIAYKVTYQLSSGGRRGSR